MLALAAGCGDAPSGPRDMTVSDDLLPLVCNGTLGCYDVFGCYFQRIRGCNGDTTCEEQAFAACDVMAKDCTQADDAYLYFTCLIDSVGTMTTPGPCYNPCRQADMGNAACLQCVDNCAPSDGGVSCSGGQCSSEAETCLNAP